MLTIGQEVEGVIRALDAYGNGILPIGRDRVLVRFVQPQERVRIRISKRIREGYAGRIVKVLKPHPDRVEPPCPLFERCGSCQLMYLDYKAQCKRKRQRVIAALQESGLSMRVHAVVGMDEPYHYRNKMIVGFFKDQNGDIKAGLYEEFSHRIAAYQRCLLHPASCDAIIQTICELMKRFRIEPYDPKWRRGFLRHVLLRYSAHSKEVLLTLVCQDSTFAARKAFVSELIKRHPCIVSVVQNINKRDTSIVLGSQERVLYGNGRIEDVLLGKRFVLSSASFYQINHAQCEKLYQKAYELLALDGTETVLDAYCGIGTIGLCAAEKMKKLVGVEVNANAVADAKINAARNKVKNAVFRCADAGVFMRQEKEKRHQYDAVILDPPREGSSPAFLQACAALGPKKIVYISCNPLTQIRDLIDLRQQGYQCHEMFLYDLFPQTEHVESIVLLSKLKSDQHISMIRKADEFDLVVTGKHIAPI